MLAEKAALLSGQEQEGEAERDEDDHQLPQTGPAVDDRSPPTHTQPLTTPGDGHVLDPLSTTTTVGLPEPDYSQPISEKARGKMRATSVSSLSSPTSTAADLPDDELLKVALAGVGPNGYIPTQEWVSSWQKG